MAENRVGAECANSLLPAVQIQIWHGKIDESGHFLIRGGEIACPGCPVANLKKVEMSERGGP